MNVIDWIPIDSFETPGRTFVKQFSFRANVRSEISTFVTYFHDSLYLLDS